MNKKSLLLVTGLSLAFPASNNTGGTSKADLNYALTYIDEEPKCIEAEEKPAREVISEYISSTEKLITIPVYQWCKEAYIDSSTLSTTLVREMIFREEFFEKSDVWAHKLKDKFGNKYPDFVYQRLVTSIGYEVRNLRNRKSTGAKSTQVQILSDEFIDHMLSTHTLQSIIKHASVRDGFNLAEILQELKTKDTYTTAPSYGVISKNGIRFMGRSTVNEELAKRGVGIVSTLAGNLEDGSSMHKYRTGLELKESTYHNLLTLVDILKQEIPGICITIRGGREFGHACNNQVSHGKNTFGDPLRSISDACMASSHEMGNCVDIRLSGKDGIQLYQWLQKYSNTPQGIKSDTNYRVKHNNIRFKFRIHGKIPLGWHLHCWLY